MSICANIVLYWELIRLPAPPPRTTAALPHPRLLPFESELFAILRQLSVAARGSYWPKAASPHHIIQEGRMKYSPGMA